MVLKYSSGGPLKYSCCSWFPTDNGLPLVAGRYGHSLVGVPLPDSSPPQCLVVSFGGYDGAGQHCTEPEMLRILQVGHYAPQVL